LAELDEDKDEVFDGDKMKKHIKEKLALTI